MLLESVVHCVRVFSDKLFPALGFGAKVPPRGHVSHEIFLVSFVQISLACIHKVTIAWRGKMGRA